MKKTAALALALTMILCIFAACGAKTIKGAEMVSDEAGHEYAVATEEGGGYNRDANGDIILVVTDENGKAFTKDNGEKVTEGATLNHALVIGNLIEFDDYYIELPGGWVNDRSYADMSIKKEGTEDRIKVVKYDDKSVAELTKEFESIREYSLTKYEGSVKKNFPIDINGETTAVYAIFVPSKSTYIAQTYLSVNGYSYVFNITSNRDLTDSMDEIVKILSTIKFK